MNFYLGDYVRTIKHGHRGRVIEKDRQFDFRGETMSADEWLKIQEIPLHPSLLEEHWYHILCENGGAVYCNESDLQPTDKFELNNPHITFFFKE